MEELELLMEMTGEEMNKSIEHLRVALSKIRAGKANPSMLGSVTIEYYGAATPLSQVSTVTTPDARSLMIKPWEKTLLGDIEKAIFGANLGFTPQNDGEQIRINIPAMTEERRRDLAKQIKAEGENAKIGVRNARKGANNSVKQMGKDSTLSEDKVKNTEIDIDDLTKNYTDKIDILVKAKEAEVMSI